MSRASRSRRRIWGAMLSALAGLALGRDDPGDEFVSGGLSVVERLLGLGFLELRDP